MHIPVCIAPTAVIMNMMRPEYHEPDKTHLKRMKELDAEIARLKAENAEHRQPQISLASMDYFKREIKLNYLFPSPIADPPTSSDI